MQHLLHAHINPSAALVAPSGANASKKTLGTLVSGNKQLIFIGHANDVVAWAGMPAAAFGVVHSREWLVAECLDKRAAGADVQKAQRAAAALATMRTPPPISGGGVFTAAVILHRCAKPQGCQVDMCTSCRQPAEAAFQARFARLHATQPNIVSMHPKLHTMTCNGGCLDCLP